LRSGLDRDRGEGPESGSRCGGGDLVLVWVWCCPLRRWVGKYLGERYYPGVWGSLYAEACPHGRTESGWGAVSCGWGVCCNLVRVPEVVARQFCGGHGAVCVVKPRVCGECGADVIHQAASFPEGWGVPVSSHLRSASCRASMCPRVMQLGGNSWGCLSPRRRCRVVLMANVPRDHACRGA